ncbi:hypothetical protein [Pelagicoccus sp. SDUM812003]|uniref:hypothetical protein n=1 Tax=Pelagicoccus sp. SDUM812003 TaxID=3041267 RepID=UPI00280F8F36|nr:hypothetical protein [Pelagicoccus sp. SDUM812003]MDQ8203616.1 hypothetical protein [Pelagicoccus sp. SDUM812003]
MSEKTESKAKGWKTLGVWVTLAFVLLVGAWAALIAIASKNAPEPVPLERTTD